MKLYSLKILGDILNIIQIRQHHYHLADGSHVYDFHHLDIKVNGLILLLEELKHNDYQSQVIIDFNGCNLSDHMIWILSLGLSSKYCPQNLVMNLSNNNITKNGSLSLAKVLARKNNLKQLTLNLHGNNIKCQGAMDFVNASESFYFPKQCTLHLSHNGIGANGIYCLVNSPLFKLGQVYFHQNKLIGAYGGEVYALALIEGRVSPNSIIDLAITNLGDEGLLWLSAALATGCAPQFLTLDLTLNYFGNIGVKYLSEAIKTSYFPANLTLKLHLNKIDGAEVLILMNAIGDGCAPNNLTIDFGFISMSSLYQMKLLNILNSSKNNGLLPYGLVIKGLNDQLDLSVKNICAENDRNYMMNNQPEPNDSKGADNSVVSSMDNYLSQSTTSSIPFFALSQPAVLTSNSSIVQSSKI